MKVYSYLVEHDYGLAPNPFGRFCTLAVCKPKIRKSSKLELGDWVIGTGSKALQDATGKLVRHRLIFVMKISEIITFEEYWDDPRFQYKKPVMNGPLVTMFGDNFYHKDEGGNWIQEDSAHAELDGTCNHEHLKIDISGNNVLISEEFYYFGDKAPPIPDMFKEVCHTGIGHKKLPDKIGNEFIDWLKTNFKTGIHGDPISWVEYSQYELSLSFE